jgi:hypothetical protein
MPCLAGALANLGCLIITGVIFPETLTGKKTEKDVRFSLLFLSPFLTNFFMPSQG